MLGFNKESTLTIYMKSGNFFVLDRVQIWEVRYTGDDIDYFRIQQHPKAKFRLCISTLKLAQIEAMTETK